MKTLQAKLYILFSLFFLSREKLIKDTITNIPGNYKNVAYLTDIEFTIFGYFAYKYTHSAANEKKEFEKNGITVSYKELNRLYVSTPHLATVLKKLQDEKLIKKSTLSEDKRKTNYILPYGELKKFNEINITALKFCGFNDSDTPIVESLLDGTINLLKSNKIITDLQEKNLHVFLQKSDNYNKFYYISLALWTSRYLITNFQIKLMGPSEFMVYAMIIKYYIRGEKKPITTKKVKEETGLAPSIISQSFKKFIDEDIIIRKEINKFKVYFHINRKSLEKRLANDTILIDEITKKFKKGDDKKFEKFIDKLSDAVTAKLNGLETNKICANKKCGMEIPLMPGLKYCPYCGQKIA
jgi:DNA-binding MarR family transcriptional regulator